MDVNMTLDARSEDKWEIWMEQRRVDDRILPCRIVSTALPANTRDEKADLSVERAGWKDRPVYDGPLLGRR